MKIQELIEPIEEASFGYSNSKAKDAVAFYGKARQSIPGVVVFNDRAGSHSMHEATMYTVAVIKPKLAHKKYTKYRQLLQGGDLSYMDAKEYDKLETYLDNILVMSTKKIGDPFWLNDYPDVAKIHMFTDRAKFFKFMTTDLGMPLASFTKFFGEEPEDHTEFEQFRNIRVFFPDNIQKNNKKKMLGMLADFDTMLSAHGLNYLFDATDIMFTRLSGKVVGKYMPSTKDIRIKPLVKSSHTIVHTIIHEYGHKMWYEFMPDNIKREIIGQFSEVRKAGHSYASTSDLESRKDELFSELKVGMQVDYKGRKRGYKQASPFLVHTIEPSGKVKLSSHQDPNQPYLSGPVGFLLNSQWSIPDVNTDYQKSNDHVVKSEWFPSHYSQTDAEEWFSELFGYYILDMLQGEPAEWMAKILRHGKPQ